MVLIILQFDKDKQQVTRISKRVIGSLDNVSNFTMTAIADFKHYSCEYGSYVVFLSCQSSESLIVCFSSLFLPFSFPSTLQPALSLFILHFLSLLPYYSSLAFLCLLLEKKRLFPLLLEDFLG